MNQHSKVKVDNTAFGMPSERTGEPDQNKICPLQGNVLAFVILCAPCTGAQAWQSRP